MLKLKLQDFGHLMWTADTLEKTLMLGGIGSRRRRGDRGWDGWMASPTWWVWVWVGSGNWWWTGKPWHAAVHGVAELDTTEQLNWTKDWLLLSPCPPSASLKTAILHLYTNLAIGSPTPTPNCRQPQMLVSMYLCKLGSVERRGRHSPL